MILDSEIKFIVPRNSPIYHHFNLAQSIVFFCSLEIITPATEDLVAQDFWRNHSS